MALNKEIEICQKISSEVKNTFLQVYNALKKRETQLLRQIEVLVQHCSENNSYEKCFKQISVVFDNELDILLSISKFGRINFNGLSHDSNFFKIEDYQHPDNDHVSLFKCVPNENECQNVPKIIETKTKLPIENIIERQEICKEKEETKEIKNENPVPNVMLECIEKQDPSLCLYESDKKKLSNDLLTEDQDIFSSCCSSPIQINPTLKYCDTLNDLQDLYSSVNSISNSISEPNLTCRCNNESLAELKSYSVQENFLKDNLSVNSADELKTGPDCVKKLSMKQPVQVQEWMKHIISEPETEPAPNNVMEHSQIKIFHKETS